MDSTVLPKAAGRLPGHSVSGLGRPAPFDPAVILDAWRLIVGSIGRHRWLLLLAVLGGLGSSAALLRVLPRSYHAECRLLAQRNLIMPALGNPRRSVPIDSDNPTRGVSEIVLTRDNLIELIKHTGLRDRWDAERSPLMRLKDLVLARARKPLTEAQRLEAMIGILEKRLTVETDDNSVTLAIDWPSARTGADLLQVAEDNFLETRHATEVSKIGETIKILEGHAADIRSTIDSTFLQLEGTEGDTEPPRSPSAKATASAPNAEERFLQMIQKREFADAPVDEPSLSDLERERLAAKSVTGEVVDEKRSDYPKARLKIAFDNYDDLERRIDAARIELDTAEAAFKYRYRVIEPVVIPERPTSPKAPVILAAGIGLGFLLGLFMALGLDLRGELIESAWQLEQRLKIPVLVELRDK